MSCGAVGCVPVVAAPWGGRAQAAWGEGGNERRGDLPRGAGPQGGVPGVGAEVGGEAGGG